MKTYRTAQSLHIVGQAYEVRWQLRRLLEQAADPHAPLFASSPKNGARQAEIRVFPLRCAL